MGDAHFERPIFNNFPKEKLMRMLDETELKQVSGGLHWPFAINFSHKPWPPVIHTPSTVPQPLSTPVIRPIIW